MGSKELSDLKRMVFTIQSLIENKEQEDNLNYHLQLIYRNFTSIVKDFDKIIKLHENKCLITKKEIGKICDAWKILPQINRVSFYEIYDTNHRGFDHSFSNVEELIQIIKNWDAVENPIVKDLKSKACMIDLDFK